MSSTARTVSKLLIVLAAASACAEPAAESAPSGKRTSQTDAGMPAVAADAAPAEPDSGAPAADAGEVTIIDPGSASFDPAEVYVLGLLMPPSCEMQAVAQAREPDRVWAGFPCQIETRRMRVRPSDGTLWYLVFPRDLRVFSADRLAVRANGAFEYPADPAADDELVATECVTDESVRFWFTPDAGALIYACMPTESRDCVLARCGRYFDGQGAAVDVADGYDVVHVGYDGNLLLFGGSSAEDLGYAVQAPDGSVLPVAYDPRDYPAYLLPGDDSIVVRARPDGFWLLMSAPHREITRFHISHAGVLRFEGYYPRTKLQLGLWTGSTCALDAAGDAYCADSQHIYRMTLAAATPDIVYDTAQDAALVQLHGPSLLSGP